MASEDFNPFCVYVKIVGEHEVRGCPQRDEKKCGPHLLVTVLTTRMAKRDIGTSKE